MVKSPQIVSGIQLSLLEVIWIVTHISTLFRKVGNVYTYEGSVSCQAPLGGREHGVGSMRDHAASAWCVCGAAIIIGVVNF